MQLLYRGEFNHITRNFDVLVRSNYSAPALQNFYGWGNNTHRQQGHSYEYYQIRYNSFEFEALVHQRLFEKFHAMLGPYFYSYSANYNKNLNNDFAKPLEIGLDSADIFSKKAYLGAKMVLLVDNRNSEFFPTRGIYWVTEFTGLAGMKSGSNKYLSLTSDMTIYASLSMPAKLVAILKVGGGRIFTRNFEYFQALSLGANLNLNGFRKNRYTGRIMTYGSLELKYKIADINSYIIPGTLGISAFGDVGRVRYENDGSQKWRTAYGVGIYYLPFNLFAINATAGFNAGEKFLTFSLGTKINLSY
jgi:outer membrane protein assembly factor BamA